MVGRDTGGAQDLAQGGRAPKLFGALLDGGNELCFSHFAFSVWDFGLIADC